jgi:hypothetical protein
MIANRIIQMALATLFLSGCGVMAEYEDVSTEQTYRSLIGRELRATSELLLHAVTLDRNYAKRVDLCSITPRPGFDGPEVVMRRVLPAGTNFRVLRVRRCTNCLFQEQVELVVRSQSTTECGQAPATIDHGALGSSVILVSSSLGGAPNNSFKPKPLRGSA